MLKANYGMAEMDSSDCVAGTGALKVWCDGKRM